MNEYLQRELEELENFDEERKKAFEINNLESLTWAFKKLASINAELKEKEHVANAERLKIDEWLKSASEPLKHSKDFFEYNIKSYHERELANNPDKKSISTPYGKVKSTTTQAQPSVSDKARLLDYAKSTHVELVEVKEDVKWGELKKRIHIDEFAGDLVIVDEYGQLVPGVEVKPKNTTFKIEGV